MIEKLIDARFNVLYHYSPFSFLVKADKDKIFNYSIREEILNGIENNEISPIEISIKNNRYVFLLKYLHWDTGYFGIPTYKLLFILRENGDEQNLVEAISQFKEIFIKKNKCYCFSEIPSEDIWTIQALNKNGFKLVETRMTYYLDLNIFSNQRYSIRQGTVEDITNLKRVAREMRNIYDRFHADSIYSQKKADEFLSTYIEESLKGFADFVIVPNEKGVAPDAFLTANYLNSEWDKIGEKISKMVLSAVSSTTCRGWYIKLISEMAYHLKSIGANFAFMHPATTNRAVIHSYEKLGCKYGKSIHVLTFAYD